MLTLKKNAWQSKKLLAIQSAICVHDLYEVFERRFILKAKEFSIWSMGNYDEISSQSMCFQPITRSKGKTTSLSNSVVSVVSESPVARFVFEENSGIRRDDRFCCGTQLLECVRPFSRVVIILKSISRQHHQQMAAWPVTQST